MERDRFEWVISGYRIASDGLSYMLQKKGFFGWYTVRIDFDYKIRWDGNYKARFATKDELLAWLDLPTTQIRL